MPLDRKAFFDAVRVKPFDGSLTPTQVENLNVILDEWDRRRLTDLRWLAYALATVRGECGVEMHPVEEIGRGRGKRYGQPDPVTGKTYYGRGYVQLTWKDNYQKMTDILGIDLVNHPERAFNRAIAVKIMFEGMIRGTFTGKKLSTYFNTKTDDPVNARRIINGTDKAATFAAWHRSFLAALTKAGASHVPAPAPKHPIPPKTTGTIGGAVTGAVVANAAGFNWLEVALAAAAIGVIGFAIGALIHHVRKGGDE